MAKIKNTSSNILTRVLLIVLTGSFLFFFFETIQSTYSSYTYLQKEIELNIAEKSEMPQAEKSEKSWTLKLKKVKHYDPRQIHCF